MDTGHALIERICQVLKRHPFVLRAEVFGSVARGEERPDSDVDLVVASAPRTGLLDLAGLADDIQRSTGRPASLLAAEIVDQPRKPSHAILARHIQPDRKLIYARGA
jgi:predicted nucleotidyltransferase